MAADQVELQLAQARPGDVDVGEAAEAGGDAVDHAARGHRLVDDPARRFDPRAGAGSDRDALAAQRHRLETVEGQAGAVEDEIGSVGSAGHGVVSGRAQRV